MPSLTGSILSTENLPIRYTLFYREAEAVSKRVLIFVHGVKGFKDWGAFPEGCRWLAARGFNVVSINLSRNGVGERAMEFDRLDLFADSTLSQDLNDVGSIIDAIDNHDIAINGKPLIPTSLGIIGHSRGGHSVIAAADRYPQIRGVVTWAAVDDYLTRWNSNMISDWNERGFTEIPNARTGQIMRLNRVVYDDSMTHADSLIAIRAIKKLEIPCCFIHGSDDESVPRQAALNLFEACTSIQKSLVIIDGTGHTFDTKHPNNSEALPDAYVNALETTKDFLAAHLPV